MALELTLISDLRKFRILSVDTGELRTSLKITMDERSSWTFDVPSWRPIAVGSGPKSRFLWSARELILLPQDSDDEPQFVAETEEDIIAVFEKHDGWVLVCETSVRRFVHDQETARCQLSDVVTEVWWRGDVLHVEVEGRGDLLLRVVGPDLVLEASSSESA